MISFFKHSNRDLISSLVLIGVGILFCIVSLKYGSAGFFPFAGGAILIVLSIINLVASFGAPGAKESFFPKKYSWKRILVSLFSLIAYGVFLKLLGFFLATFLFMVFSLRFIEPLKWRAVVTLSLLTSALCYLIFQVWLGVQLPHGIILPEIGKWIL
jgi:putative tricarboxylic transport membrane protein